MNRVAIVIAALLLGACAREYAACFQSCGGTIDVRD
jgi:hypothetical protein